TDGWRRDMGLESMTKKHLVAELTKARGELARLTEAEPCRSSEEAGWSDNAVREIGRAKKDWERTFDAIEDFVTILDPKRRVVRMNRAIRVAFDCDSRESRRVRCYDLFYNKSEPCRGCPAPRVLDDHKSHSAEFKNRQLGKTFWVTASPILDESGKLIGLVHVTKDVTARKKAEEELKRAYDEMESRVKERTAKLTDANLQLQKEIAERTRIEEVLRKREAELDFRSRNLEEVNIALRVLLKARQDDKRDLEEQVLSNVKELVRPYVERLENSNLDLEQKAYLAILKSNLDDIVSPFAHKLSSKYLNFTPQEIRVAKLVRDGKTNKEIADTLNVSSRTVAFHRENIRKKLELKNTRANLRSHLMSLQ
ncbi:MAG: LuxR C-terminal-related transcriptional regulator, partial [Deltaproteobacteria bacterium]